MHSVEHSIHLPHSIQENYDYHLEQASQFLEYAEEAHQALEHAMQHFHRHNDWLKQHASKNFIA